MTSSLTLYVVLAPEDRTDDSWHGLGTTSSLTLYVVLALKTALMIQASMALE